MGFWDKVGGKVGGAAKWITDPKQLLTAAGFALGGPVGAGVGRAVGGVVPQSAGPVPWGALGADTDEFRKSTLADGLQWGDVGQAGKDFMSGYSAGKVGQQVPGIRDLEGAFAQGGMWGGPAMPNQPQLGPGQIPGQSALNAQQPIRMPEVSYQGPGRGAPSSLVGAMSNQDMGAEALMRNNPGFMPEADFGPEAQRFTERIVPEAERFTKRNLLEKGLDQGKGFWSQMTGIEKIYAMNALANAGSSVAGGIFGGGGFGQEGRDALGRMGLFSPTQRRRRTSFDEWRSRGA